MMGYGRFAVKVAVLNVFELTFLEFDGTIVYIMIESKPPELGPSTFKVLEYEY